MGFIFSHGLQIVKLFVGVFWYLVCLCGSGLRGWALLLSDE